MKSLSSKLMVFLAAASSFLFTGCQKDASLNSSPTNSSSFVRQPSSSQSGANGYGSGATYEIELSANISGSQGGGVWLWIALYPNWQGDYSGADCGHGPAGGAASDKGDVTWQYTGVNNQWVVINGVSLNGLGGFPTTITVPAQTGHYTGTIGTYLTLPSFIPPSIGTSQLQVAP